MRTTESTAWADHVGHRLACEPTRADSGPATGVTIYCQHCGVTLAHRPDAPGGGGEPAVADALDPLLIEVIGVVACLRSALIDARTPPPPRNHEFRVPGYPALVLPPFDADPYWRGYRDAFGSSQEVYLAALCQMLEDAAVRHVPAPDRETAWRFVRGAVLDRLKALRTKCAAPAPVGGPHFAKSSGTAPPPP